MPKYIDSIKGIKESFQRPVIIEVLRDVMRWTGISNNTRIIFPGETEKVYQPGTTVDTQASHNQFESQRAVTIRVSEEISEDHTVAISARNLDHIEIFVDNESSVYVRPIYNPVTYTIEMTYRAHDLDSANLWRDEIIARVATFRDYLMHQPKYSYVFPETFMRVLYHIHELRNKGPNPYNDDFSTYIRNHITSRASVLTMANGEEGRWAISESQSRVIGWFDFNNVPDKPEKHNNTSAHNITISYKVMMERPTACVIEYPLIINNHLIDEHFRPIFKEYTIPEVASFASRSNIQMGIFEAGERFRHFQQKDFGIFIPDYLEFLPKQIPNNTKNIATMLTTIDYDNPHVLMNLTQLGDWEFRPDVIEFLREEHQWLNQLDKSIFNLSVYRNKNMIHPSKVKVDINLNVVLLDEPNPRDIFHVRLAINTTVSNLVKEAKERLRNHAHITLELLEIIHPEPNNAYSTGMVSSNLSQHDYRLMNNYKEVDKVSTTINQEVIKDNPRTYPSTAKPGITLPNTYLSNNNKFTVHGQYPIKDNSIYLFGKHVTKILPKAITRKIPWDGIEEVIPGSTSNGIIPKVEFEKTLSYLTTKDNAYVRTKYHYTTEMGHKRVMGLFVQTGKLTDREYVNRSK